jgi:hypothetical protein
MLQNDTRTNIAIADQSRDIAKQSYNIAKDAKRDSTALKAIAAVTMLFLPGTFVAVSIYCPYPTS